MEQEYDNLRADLEWSLGARQAIELGVRLANALVWFWDRVCVWHEAGFWIEKALDLSLGLGRTAVRAKALTYSGILQGIVLGKRARGQVLLEESLEIWRTLSPAHRLDYAYTLSRLGCVLGRAGDLEKGRIYLEARDIFREAGDYWGAG